MAGRLSREEVLKKKAEDEARRAGTLPAEKDAHGRVINPHIPEFMKVAPWYMGNETVGLDHQRLPESQKYSSDIHAGWYERGRNAFTSSSASSSKKPTCTNCGASTHVAKNCLEKPRKTNATKVGVKIGSEDVAQPVLSLSYDGKRDVYNGFDADAQMRALQRRNQLLPKNQDIAPQTTSGGGSVAKSDKEKSDPMLPKASLRVRSDLAKYLRNLDPESAFYDPKTRSMRANPNPEVPLDQLTFAGDNFVRNTGEAVELEKMEAFASQRSMETSDASQAVQANPTALALAKKEFEARKEKLAAERKQKIEEQYGKSAAASVTSKALAQASSAYVEYAPDGKLLTDSIVAPVTMSKYDEDVLERNHTKVWGSYFDRFSMAWGYACCWQTVRSSFCTGEAGKQAIRESLERARPRSSGDSNIEDRSKSIDTAAINNGQQVEVTLPPSVSASTMYGEASVETKFDPAKLAEALKRVQQPNIGAEQSKKARDDETSSDWSTSSNDEREKGKKSTKKDRRKTSEGTVSSSSDWSSDSSEGAGKRGRRKKSKKHKKEKKNRKEKKHKKSRREHQEESDAKNRSSKKPSSLDEYGRDSKEITPEDIEAYRLTRIRAGDPMANMVNNA